MAAEGDWLEPWIPRGEEHMIPDHEEFLADK